MSAEVTNNPKPMRGTRVLLVTSDREACGIREYGHQLMRAAFRPGLEFAEFPHTDPQELYASINSARASGAWFPDVIHLNHHAALHSGWRAEHVRELRAAGLGVVVTQHDTYETAEIMWERGFQDFRDADYLFVHEHVEGLADLARHAAVLKLSMPVPVVEVPEVSDADAIAAQRGLARPVLGLFGFDFPWKNFDIAVAGAARAGWDVRVYSNNLTEARTQELWRLNRGAVCAYPGYRRVEDVVRALARCDATAFLYVTGNSGASGAIRAGIAAQRPLLAAPGCRQFRDLERDEFAHAAIEWVPASAEAVAGRLRFLEANGAVRREQQDRLRQLAHRDSWSQAGWAYAACYRALADREPQEPQPEGSAEAGE
jgi:glycosyltransferase involved in cell wall biosynthesis